MRRRNTRLGDYKSPSSQPVDCKSSGTGHQGNWTVIVDAEGEVEQELSYDAWGNQRDPNTWQRNWYNPALEEPMFDRGYTGHEHMTAFGLINMNGRCYDPVMSSFLSVDAYVQSPDNSQNFNRYAYCLNNPLKYTDPSGWVLVGGTTPRNAFHDNWSNTYAQPVFEPRDFTNPYNLLNESLKGGSGCSVSSTSFAAGTRYYNNKGYGEIWVSDLQIIWNFIKNPNYTTRKDVVSRGLTDYNFGYSVGKDGLGTFHIDYIDNHDIEHNLDFAVDFHTSGFSDYGTMSINLSIPVEETRYTYTCNDIGFAPFNFGDTYNNFQQANYKMVYNAIINPQTNRLYVNASSYNTPVMNATVLASAQATLFINGKIVETKGLKYDGETIITPPLCTFVGSTSFSLPESGTASLLMEGGWCLDYSFGIYIPTKGHWASPITVNANHTFQIRPKFKRQMQL